MILDPAITPAEPEKVQRWLCSDGTEVAGLHEARHREATLALARLLDKGRASDTVEDGRLGCHDLARWMMAHAEAITALFNHAKGVKP